MRIEKHIQERITCDCAKNTRFPCMALCYQCVETGKGDVKMRKPLHWADIADENRAILSTVGMLKIHETFRLLEDGCSKEEIESALWGIWEENHKDLRPHVYDLLKVSKKIVNAIYKRIEKKRDNAQSKESKGEPKND